MEKDNKKLEKGVILYLALMIISVLLNIGLGVSLIILDQMTMIRGMGNSVVAFQAADTGVERILYEYKKCQEQTVINPGDSCPDVECNGDLDRDMHCDGVSDSYSTTEISFAPNESYIAQAKPGESSYVLESRGKFLNSVRAIQIFIPNYRRVFVTSATFTGDLVTACQTSYGTPTECTGGNPSYSAGLNSADFICKTLASNAGLPGIYKAWLSDSITDARDRFLDTSTISYRTVDEALVALNWVDLITDNGDGNYLKSLINKTETGGSPVGDAFTNTDSDGTKLTSSCSDWNSIVGTSTIGESTKLTDEWTNYGGKNCGNSASLYCFQQ